MCLRLIWYGTRLPRFPATSLQRDPIAASSPHHYDNRRLHLAQYLNYLSPFPSLVVDSNLNLTTTTTDTHFTLRLLSQSPHTPHTFTSSTVYTSPQSSLQLLSHRYISPASSAKHSVCLPLSLQARPRTTRSGMKSMRSISFSPMASINQTLTGSRRTAFTLSEYALLQA